MMIEEEVEDLDVLLEGLVAVPPVNGCFSCYFNKYGGLCPIVKAAEKKQNYSSATWKCVQESCIYVERNHALASWS